MMVSIPLQTQAELARRAGTGTRVPCAGGSVRAGGGGVELFIKGKNLVRRIR